MSAPTSILRENRDVASFFCTKHGHALKGKYKRIFSVGTHAITTYNPNTMEVTNQWPYDEFISIVPNVKSPGPTEFLINMKKKNGKTDTMKFSSDHRADILSEALRFNGRFADRHLSENRRFNSSKHHWSDARVPIVLEVNQGSLDQVDPVSRRRICSYDYKEMEGLALVSDYPGGLAVIYGGFSRLHLFATENREELIKAIIENANCYVGIPIKIKKDPISFEQFQRHRLGKYSTDEALTSMAEFSVYKFCPLRHPMEPAKRLLCLTETCLIERDPSSYAVVTCRPLSEIHTLIRYQEDPQRFSVEYVKGFIRTYNSTDRDSLLASLLDGVRASGNRDVHVRSTPTNKGYRQGPMTIPVDEEVETRHVKLLQQLPPGMTFLQAVQRFNSNIPYSGLLHAVTQESFFAENKEKLINGAISALLTNEGDQAAIGLHDLEEQFLALRRLVASKAGFNAFTQLPKFREKMGIKVVKALKRNNEGVAHSAIDTLNALIQPMHDNYDLRQEQLNKASILSSKRFLESLLEMFSSHVLRGTGALVISALLDFLTFALCAPYSETTHGEHFDSLLEMVATHGRAMFKLFQHPSMAIVKGAGLIMKAIIEEGEPEIASKMQGLALAEGALPSHLLTAMFTVSTDSRMLTNRQLSRHLVGLWVTGHPVANNLLKRILPAGLTAYLDSDAEVPDDEDLLHVRDTLAMAQEDDANKNTKTKQQIKELQIQLKIVERQLDQALSHWRARLGLEHVKLPTSGGGGVSGLINSEPEVKPVVLRKRRQRIKSEANWPLFYYQFNCDHAKPNLIWNRKVKTVVAGQ